MAIDFPNTPSDGQVYFDNVSGIRYVYDATGGIWLARSNSFYSSVETGQVIFDNADVTGGSNGLYFSTSANTLYANSINVATDMRVRGNLYIGTNTVTITDSAIMAQTFYIMENGTPLAVPTGTAANASYAVANAAFGHTNTTLTHSQAVYAAVNSAFGAVNSAYDTANSKVSKSGDTITGTLSIVGDLIVSGNTRQINANTMSVSDPLIYLAANNYTSDIVDIGFIANYVNTAGANVHTGLYREHENKEYYLFQGYDREPINNHIGAMSNNMTLSVLNADIRTSNLNLGGANAITWISSGYGVANGAFGSANSKVATVSGTSGRITSSGTTGITLDLATAGPGAGSYSSGISALTLDAYGRVTAVTGSANYVVSGGALGTPSSGTLTNCTFPTLNQNTTGTAGSAGFITGTNIGKTGSQGFMSTTSWGTADWANQPISGLGMTIANTPGAPNTNYGFFNKFGNRDAGGPGWGGLWMEYDGGSLWYGSTVVSTSFATWKKVLDASNYTAYSNFGTNSVYGGTYYDGNNTGYYIDSAATSNMSIVTATRLCAGYNSGDDNSVQCSNWFRSSGGSGWYNQTYSGGIHMSDTTYIRTYGSKIFYCDQYIIGESSVRSRIFYDYDDTNYYCDPNGTTRLNDFIVKGMWADNVLIADLSGSGASTIESTTCFTSGTYRAYEIQFQVVPGTMSAGIYMQFYVGGAWRTTAGDYRTYSAIWNAGGSQGYGPNSYVDIGCGGRIRNYAGLTGIASIVFPSRTDTMPIMTGIAGAWDSTIDGGNKINFTGLLSFNSAISGFRIYASSGTISGYVKVYGRR